MKKAFVLILTLFLSACAGSGTDTVRSATPPLYPPPKQNMPAPTSEAYPLPPAPALQATAYPQPSGETPMPTVNPENDIFRPLRPARDYLAQRLDLPPQEIQVATYEQANFPDGCLGLPQPGEMCIQVITPGYVVTFHTVKGDFVFHVAQSGNPFRMRGGGQDIQDK